MDRNKGGFIDMIKLGLHSAILPELSFNEIVDYISSLGLETLEVCCWPKGKAKRRYAGVTHIDVDNLDDAGLIECKEYAENKGVKIAVLGYYPNPLSNNQEEADAAIKHIHKMIDASAVMEINKISTFIGKDKTLPVDENIAKMKKVWPQILEHAEDKDVKIGIENCHMFYSLNEWPGGNNLACSPHVWREMFKMSPNIGLSYDPSHPIVLGMDFDAHLREFGDRIFHVHFKDCHIEQDKVNEYGRFDLPGLWHTPKLPGLGDVNFSSFISTLNTVGYRGAGVIEVEDKSFENSLEDTKMGIEEAVRYLRQFC